MFDIFGLDKVMNIFVFVLMNFCMIVMNVVYLIYFGKGLVFVCISLMKV